MGGLVDELEVKEGWGVEMVCGRGGMVWIWLVCRGWMMDGGGKKRRGLKMGCVKRWKIGGM